MIRLLTKKDTGAPTAAARSLAQTYREILIDEYQDSNAVQECIFQAVSREGKNLFLVGDVKQSILVSGGTAHRPRTYSLQESAVPAARKAAVPGLYAKTA